MTHAPPVRFSVIGLNHDHIYGQVSHLLRAGARLAAFHAPEDALAHRFAATYPDARREPDPAAIYEDPSIQMIVTAAIPRERAEVAVRAMRCGKDVMSDKPGVTTLEGLARVRQVQAETGRIYSICYSEHFDVPAVVKAGHLVREGRIGRVVQTLGLGPHRINLPSRPGWFFRRAESGGILADIGSHQVEQFLFFTGSSRAEVVGSAVANYRHPEHPELEDFGELTLRGDGGHGYARLDWYTPAGLPTWGDGRLTILGTEGYIELRKYIDVEGRPGTDHLFLVDAVRTEYLNCQGVPLEYGHALVHDLLHRTGTAMPQERCFLAAELALLAQRQAVLLGALGPLATEPAGGVAPRP